MNDHDHIELLREKRTAKRLKRKKNRGRNLHKFRLRMAVFEESFPRNQRRYIKVSAPKIFSLLTNREETIRYFNKVNGMLGENVYTNMDMSDIEYADLPTICTLTSFMLDRRTNAQYLQVTIPKHNRPSRKIWDDVQFESMIVRDKRANFGSGRFLSRSSMTVNGRAMNDILNSTLKFFGEHRKGELRDLAAALSEIIENTTLHASPDLGISGLPWIINTRDMHDNGRKEREYCIVDLGVGVYDSIKENVKRWNTTGAKLMHRLTRALDDTKTQSAFLSRNIPSGIGSSTNQVTRGKGIKHVYEISQSPIYQSFDIITNKAQVHLKDVKTIEDDSAESLLGTVYYWKIAFDE